MRCVPKVSRPSLRQRKERSGWGRASEPGLSVLAPLVPGVDTASGCSPLGMTWETSTTAWRTPRSTWPKWTAPPTQTCAPRRGCEGTPRKWAGPWALHRLALHGRLPAPLGQGKFTLNLVSCFVVPRREEMIN